jgi:transposase
LEIVVANAQHIKKVPGRETDVKDAEWIADLLCPGLLRSSFVPPKPIRELRDLMRHRRKLVESQAAERNRLLKVLETANIKLANVATDVFGMSGRLMLRALIQAKATPQEMAELAKGRFYARRFPNWSWLWKVRWKNTIVSCWSFSCNDSKRRKKTWQLWNNTSGRSLNLMRRSWPCWMRYRVWIGLWAVIIAELGVGHERVRKFFAVSFLGRSCSDNNESAGKRKSTRIPSGNVYLKSGLVEAANAAARAKGTYLRDKFFRLKARRGYMRAVVAITHKILVAIYHMLSQQVSYNDLGDLYLDKLNKNHLTRNLVHRLERLGYQVTLTLQEKAA